MTELDSLRQLADAIVADLQAHYGERVPTIRFFDLTAEPQGQERVAIITPAILLGIEQMDSEMSDDDGSGCQPLRLMCTADLMLSTRTADLDLELTEFARDLLGRVRFNRWGLQPAVRAPEGLSAQPARLVPEQVGYGIWRASWEQLVYLGTDAWSGCGLPPTEIYLGIAPRIGWGHEPDYWQIEQAPPV